MINLDLLKQLIYIEKYGTISDAAKHLQVSQSALSRSMQKLEKELDVTLFKRQRNKVTLNETGYLTITLGKKLLDEIENITNQIQEFDHNSRIISIGSCAPAPLWSIESFMSKLEINASYEIKEPKLLLEKLSKDDYQLIILPYKISRKGLICINYIEEHLSFSLPFTHPLANKKKLYFKDLDGETMLLLSNLGYWSNIHKEMMPHTHFLIQDEKFAFNELIKFSELPFFTSDLANEHVGKPQNRVIIPIADNEANVTYYCIYKKKNEHLLKNILDSLFNKKELLHL